ncbi:hypothetical protein ColLi_04151 [Colletotrichum liriopes]|uniref:Uncharacterized protein n=1 Tax=Colletotrichum liriopes TaxID=708192 RepID=A0AA37LRI9_9PEZI|nr:hypothetical protein ColLi_04151 [Colletotrichum liriopes]
MYPAKAIVHDENDGQSLRDLEKWLGIRTIPCLLVDTPAWAWSFLATLEAHRDRLKIRHEM